MSSIWFWEKCFRFSLQLPEKEKTKSKDKYDF